MCANGAHDVRKGNEMANNTITRTVVTANAFCWVLDGTNEDGSPRMVKSGGVEFVSTKPNQLEAFRALKASGVKCRKDFCGFDIVSETVYAMSLDDFMAHAVVVERGQNGRVVSESE